MPLRPWTRDREGVLPPNLDDWVGPDHPVRFVAAFVDELTDTDWAALGITPGGHAGGAPASDPTVLLAAWLYGCRSGLRSCRKLATACAEQLPFLWLTGGQRPDHNTWWRFDQRARTGMRTLFTRPVATAATSGLVVWAMAQGAPRRRWHQDRGERRHGPHPRCRGFGQPTPTGWTGRSPIWKRRTAPTVRPPRPGCPKHWRRRR